MDFENILANLVRIGTVSSVDSSNRTARVVFKDMDIVSGWLPVLQHFGAGVYIRSDGSHTHELEDGDPTKTGGSHNHDANVAYWMPKVNDMVVVLYLPVFNGDGFILGGI